MHVTFLLCPLHGRDLRWVPLCCGSQTPLNVAFLSPCAHTHSCMFSSALFSISSVRVNLWMCSSALLLSFSVSSAPLPFFPLSSLHPLGLYTACFSASQHRGEKLRGCLAAWPAGWHGIERCLLNSPHVPVPGIS